MSTILIIDDNDAVRTALEVLLSLQGHRILTANGPAEGMRALVSHEVDLVLQDMNFRKEATSGEEGVALFRAIRERHPTLPIVLLTAWTHLETAVELVKAGAADYLAKPWDDARLLTTVRNLLELRQLSVEKERAVRKRAESRAALTARFDLCGLVFESDAMRDLVTKATHVAPAEVPVLITGPNGSGKEIIAAIIQANSSVRSGPFVKVNVGALPKDLMEAELFGAEAGAFTGATKVRQGRFEAADGGTLFLDEIGNLSLEGQAKLLRVLQTGEFERLGSSVTRRVKVRVVSATNADLRAGIADGRFREDLFYRLNVIELRVPPLAERTDDVLPLARHFLEGGRPLSQSAERALLSHNWPGNVRELLNTIRRSSLLSTGSEITAADLGLVTQSPVFEPEPEREPDRAEIEQALARARGVIARAARDLGLSRQALYRRMEKLGLKEATGRAEEGEGD
ncbi:DNA-binding NtrC family response regulator [Povalibacter uvarum]|uniref:DNA-binding NtrC family response regulator n=1 Tax=Povalibacter uvarum TaxID=732238 RepID=A0A841HV20_9GAMM|nr:sigma-54 dependent transcriptional regulator [Povalibacter uvarum]MBB6096030.1 DNA-binding NtrC family response regulator [Povalibacter uvarum]